jgi:glucosyl-3-phosphoglycerate synthase
LNEAATVGAICERIRIDLIEKVPLVDELIVVDSGSSDETRQIAADAGAQVHLAADLVPSAPRVARGKGDALWRSLSIVASDIVVWLDADVTNFEPNFITRLLEPLLCDEGVLLTKGFYDRPIDVDGRLQPTGGARVTELVVRPLLNLFYPELTAFIQPLSGEYAGSTHALKQLPFFTGYGVEIGLLLDAVERFGLDSIAQVDLGVRVHRNRPTLELGLTALEVMQVIFTRLEDGGRMKLSDPLPEELLQFWPTSTGLTPDRAVSRVVERPPLETVHSGSVSSDGSSGSTGAGSSSGSTEGGSSSGTTEGGSWPGTVP